MLERDQIVRALEGDVLGMTGRINEVLDSRDFLIQRRFREHFREQEQAVAHATAAAATMLGVFSARLADDDLDRIRVVGMFNTSLILQLSSFKLFMFGQTVAAGALFRQVIEGVCLAFLFSVKSLPYLKRYEADCYTGKEAVRDLGRKAQLVNLNPKAFSAVRQAYDFNHKFAHLSKLTIAASANFSQGGIPHFGAQFDLAKLPEYKKEVRNRVRFASVLPNAVTLVCGNCAKW